jgi:rubredoxin
MAGKITCSNCGWSWKASESSKADLYNCHNCGANNAPAKQEEVEKAQNGKKLIPKEEELLVG